METRENSRKYSIKSTTLSLLSTVHPYPSRAARTRVYTHIREGGVKEERRGVATVPPWRDRFRGPVGTAPKPDRVCFGCPVSSPRAAAGRVGGRRGRPGAAGWCVRTTGAARGQTGPSGGQTLGGGWRPSWTEPDSGRDGGDVCSLTTCGLGVCRLWRLWRLCRLRRLRRVWRVCRLR